MAGVKSKYQQRVAARLNGVPLAERSKMPWWFSKWPYVRPNPIVDFTKCYVLREDGIDFSEEKDL